MTITMTPEMEYLIQNKIQSGRFSSPSDVVSEGLRLLEQDETRFEELKRQIFQTPLLNQRRDIAYSQIPGPLQIVKPRPEPPAPAFRGHAKCKAAAW